MKYIVVLYLFLAIFNRLNVLICDDEEVNSNATPFVGGSAVLLSLSLKLY